MIDTLSLLLAHILLFYVAVKLVVHPYVNEEPARTERHFKQVLPRKRPPRRAGVETGESRPGSPRA